MSKPRGEGAWWRSAGSGRNWVAPSSTLGSGERAFPQREIGQFQHAGNAYSEVSQTNGGSHSSSAGAGHTIHDPAVDSLIDGVLGGGTATATATTTATATATATIVEAPADTITDVPRKPIVWPPKPGERKLAPEKPAGKKGTAGMFERMKPRSTRDGHWTYAGLRPRTRVVAIGLVVAALVGAGVFTMRALAASAANTFPGVMAAQSPLELNFPTTAVLSQVYVMVGQTVKVGQPLASQQANVVSAQVVADRITFASDEERLAQLLGPVGKTMQLAAAQAYAKAQQQAGTSTQHGAQNIQDLTAILAAQQQALYGEDQILYAAQAEYNAKCSKGLGSTICASLSARVSADSSRVGATQQEISITQSKLATAQSTDKSLTQLAGELQQTAAANKSFFNATALNDITATQDALAHDQEVLTADLQALANSVMTSPVPGKVLAINAVPGDIIGLNQGVHTSVTGGLPGSGASSNGGPSTVGSGTSTSGFITIEEIPGLDATAQVPESAILAISRGEQATIAVDALGGQSYAGRVMLIEPQPVLVAGQTYYDVLIEPAVGATWPTTLLPGMTTNIKIGH